MMPRAADLLTNTGQTSILLAILSIVPSYRVFVSFALQKFIPEGSPDEKRHKPLAPGAAVNKQAQRHRQRVALIVVGAS